MLPSILTCLAAYLIGAIPFGYLVARLRGVDIFKEGSGNIGATNVGRVLGRKFGILVFTLDFLKGAGPVWLAMRVARHIASLPEDWPAGTLETAAGLSAFLGHLYPIYLGFRGGKGVATGTGVVVMLVPAAALAATATWVLVVLAFRYVSLASICAALALVLAQLRSHGIPPTSFIDDPRSWFCLLAATLVVVRHRSNIGRLLKGRENRLKESAFMFAFTKVCHVLALGLWFGSLAFFSFAVAPTLFSRFEELALRPAVERPWFPPAPLFAREDAALNGPREQGTRAAGFAVGPLFPILFLLQGVCGFAAVASALPWLRTHPRERVHRGRVTVILAALCCVLAGWPLETKVRALQGERHVKTLAYLQAPADKAEEARGEMQAARSEFGRWHLVSLLLSMLTIVLVTVALALAAFLPATPPPATTLAAAPATDAATTVYQDLPTESLEP